MPHFLEILKSRFMELKSNILHVMMLFTSRVIFKYINFGKKQNQNPIVFDITYNFKLLKLFTTIAQYRANDMNREILKPLTNYYTSVFRFTCNQVSFHKDKFVRFKCLWNEEFSCKFLGI